MHSQYPCYWLGEGWILQDPLFSQNVFAGNQCPGRPDPRCRVPWPPHFCRAVHPSPQELDREEERQWRGPGTSKWKKPWLGHSSAPPSKGTQSISSPKGRLNPFLFVHQPVTHCLAPGLWKQSALTRINTNAQTLAHLATQERKALLKSFIPRVAILATCSCLPANELSWQKEMEWEAGGLWGMKRRIWVSLSISQKCASCLERAWSTEVLLLGRKWTAFKRVSLERDGFPHLALTKEAAFPKGIVIYCLYQMAYSSYDLHTCLEWRWQWSHVSLSHSLLLLGSYLNGLCFTFPCLPVMS